MNNIDIVQQTIKLARQAGANEAEAFLHRSKVLTVEVTSGAVENIKQAEDVGLGVRVLVGKQMGMSYATDMSGPSLQRAVERAIQVARASDADEFIGLPEPQKIVEVNGFDDEFAQHSADEKIDRAFAIERAAKEYDARVVLTRRITYTERESVEAIASTRGLVAEQRNNGCGGFAMVVARDASGQEMGGGSDTKRRYAEFDAAKIGTEAGESAVEMLGAQGAQSQRASILLEPKMTGAFLSIIANLVLASNVQKNKSLFAGKHGQRVAASDVTIIDDGAYASAPGMRAWDDEGIPSQRTVVIADGVLQNYLHSSYTARKANTRSTSNAGRMSFKMPPDVAPSNFVLMPGYPSAESLLGGVQRGLLVKNLMNLHTANPISGEFSFGATGLWIENGQVAGPVRGVTIAGNLTDLLLNIRGVASDLKWQGMMGMSIGAPTVLIEDMSIAGK